MTINTHALAFMTGLACLAAVLGFTVAHRRFRRTVRYIEERLDYVSSRVAGVQVPSEPRVNEAEDKRRSYFTRPDMDRLRGRLSTEDADTLTTFSLLNEELQEEAAAPVITDLEQSREPVTDQFGRVLVHPRTTPPLLSNGGVLHKLSDDRIEGTVVDPPPGDGDEYLMPDGRSQAERDWDENLEESLELHPWDDAETALRKIERRVYGHELTKVPALTGGSS